MLIGKRGKFTLNPPFNQYSSTGLSGEIVGVNFINHLVSSGNNVERTVYSPVSGEANYASDLSSNVIIVTIKATDGKKYQVPDKYIANLYDDSLNYVDAYVTVKIGSLPRNYDYTFIKSQLATEVTKLSGVTISSGDVYVSAQDNGTILDKAEASLLNVSREANLENLDTDYGKYLNETKRNKVLSDKLSSLENTVAGWSG